MNELDFHLRRFGRRLRLRDGWLLAQRTFWLAALAGVLMQVAGRFFPIEKLGLWTALPFIAWFITVILYSIFKPRSLMQIARHVDLELELKERLSTALALRGSSNKFAEQIVTAQRVDASEAAKAQPGDRLSMSTPLLARLQRIDALTVAAGIVPAEAFALDWLFKWLATGAVLVSLILVSAIAPNPRADEIKQKAAIEQEAKKQAQQIEKAKQEIEASQDISPEMKQDLIKKLEELANSLKRNPGDLEQALADLSKLEQELKRDLNPNLASQQAMLDSLASQLAQATDVQKSQDPLQTAEKALDELASKSRRWMRENANSLLKTWLKRLLRPDNRGMRN